MSARGDRLIVFGYGGIVIALATALVLAHRAWLGFQQGFQTSSLESESPIRHNANGLKKMYAADNILNTFEKMNSGFFPIEIKDEIDNKKD